MLRRALPVLLLAALGAGPALAQERRKVPEPVACNNENQTCRESCTIEFGSSFRTRAKLGTCLNTCRARHRRCSEQWTELHRNNLDPANFARPAPAAAPAVAPAPEPAVVEGRTRYAGEASEDAAQETAGEASATASGAEREGAAPATEAERRGLEAEPGAAPAGDEEEQVAEVKPAAAKKEESPPRRRTDRPEIPPEPEYDIADWNPDAEE